MESPTERPESQRRIVAALAVALDERDSYTRHHCDRVVTLAYELGIACGISGEELSALLMSALFHDIGKIGIPDAILLKPAPLTRNEWEVMKTHSELGERIFKEAPHSNVDAIAGIIRHHHEAIDGSGYPDGLKGEAIPTVCRILTIVDGYDAMGTARPYQHARDHKSVMEILGAEQNKKIDPLIFRTFVKIIEHSSAHIK